VSTFLRPTAPIAEDALLPGDPKRAMDLAILLMDRPLMSNLARGLWGYHGRTADGLELTVQSTGIGGPSAAAVMSELVALGVRRAVRIGTCRALVPQLEPGALLVADTILPADGAGIALGGREALRPHEGLTRGLLAKAATEGGIVVSSDLHYDPDAIRRDAEWRRRGAVAVELTAAASLATASAAGVDFACALVVAEGDDGEHLSDEALDEAALALGAQAAEVLSAVPRASEPAAPGARAPQGLDPGA